MEKTKSEQDLEWVRNELDLLNFARTTWSLRPLDAVRYVELCEVERKLIRAAEAAA